jgi:ubiquinone/menaquinone biosynthesis C-methylase UbiE
VPVATSALRAERPGAAAAEAYHGVSEFFDRFAAVDAKWRKRNRTYHRLMEAVCRFHVHPGARVLEIGCGGGDLLAALRPTIGVGVDVSPGMVELARSRHPKLEFVVGAGEELELGTMRFDYVVLSDLVPYVHDLIGLFERIAKHSHPGTRIVVNSYSQLWRPVIRLAELVGLKARKPIRNWVSPSDIVNVLRLTGFEQVTLTRRILMPKQIPLLTWFLNGIAGSLWPLTQLCLTWWLIARPRNAEPETLSVSVICPCLNEAGNIAEVADRLPAMGTASELIFVEGGSTDGTRVAIARQIALHPERDISLVIQPGRGKADAVRAGFAAAKHDVLMILDGDLSVSPEDLPKFYRALADGRGDLINGSRLVYDLEPGAMRFLNLLGNRLFSLLLAAIVGQHVKDTLCGTKVLRRRDYDSIAAVRSDFGAADPFGDFDLLFGAGRLGLKIVDLPVRYQARTYGTTNISRFRHGVYLLRMTIFAFWTFRVSIYGPAS